MIPAWSMSAIVSNFRPIADAGEDQVVVAGETFTELPSAYTLSQNYPNPFRWHTTIGFYLETATVVDLSVNDFGGKRVATIVSGTRAAGEQVVTWTPSSVASGTYLYRLQAGDIETSAMLTVTN